MAPFTPRPGKNFVPQNGKARASDDRHDSLYPHFFKLSIAPNPGQTEFFLWENRNISFFCLYLTIRNN